MSAVEGIWFEPSRNAVITLDRDGRVGVHRYVATIPQPSIDKSTPQLPFTLEASEKQYKRLLATETVLRGIAWSAAGKRTRGLAFNLAFTQCDVICAF